MPDVYDRVLTIGEGTPEREGSQPYHTNDESLLSTMKIG